MLIYSKTPWRIIHTRDIQVDISLMFFSIFQSYLWTKGLFGDEHQEPRNVHSICKVSGKFEGSRVLAVFSTAGMIWGPLFISRLKGYHIVHWKLCFLWEFEWVTYDSFGDKNFTLQKPSDQNTETLCHTLYQGSHTKIDTFFRLYMNGASRICLYFNWILIHIRDMGYQKVAYYEL